MDKTKAFPNIRAELGPERGRTYKIYDRGMDLRDWFAGLAMQTLVGNEYLVLNKEIIATHAYEIAGAMMGERKKRE